MGNSGAFGSSTTAQEVVEKVGRTDLSGKVAIVTGSNTGIGKETARALAFAGVTVVMSCRDVEKMHQAKKDILAEVPKATIHDLELDLGDSKSIDNFVVAFQKLNLPGLHFLINNAGVMATPQRETKDGFEYQSGINHLGSFRLTMLLLPIMAKTKGEKRIVCVSSEGHRMCKSIDWTDFHQKKAGAYGVWSSYGQSKACNVMFASQLQRQLAKLFPRTDGGDYFIVCSLHPGVIATELTRDLPGWQVGLFSVVGPLFMKSIPQGAATSVFGALSPDVKGGEYLSDCQIASASEFASNIEEQQKLWDFSVAETKTKFPDLK